MLVKKNDIVYLFPLGDELRRNPKIREGVVVSVGRKYITVRIDLFPPMKFSIETMLEESGYSPRFCLFSSFEAAEDERVRKKLETELRERFHYKIGTLSLQQLRAISDILNDKK